MLQNVLSMLTSVGWGEMNRISHTCMQSSLPKICWRAERWRRCYHGKIQQVPLQSAQHCVSWERVVAMAFPWQTPTRILVRKTQPTTFFRIFGHQVGCIIHSMPTNTNTCIFSLPHRLSSLKTGMWYVITTWWWLAVVTCSKTTSPTLQHLPSQRYSHSIHYTKLHSPWTRDFTR